MSTGLLVKRLSEAATLPVRGSLHAAGYDLASAQDVVVPARGKLVVLTDLAIAVPEGTYGRVAPRSGLAAKHHINLGAGVIDADYRGNVGVVMFNHADQDFHVKTGDRIAQLVLERIVTPFQAFEAYLSNRCPPDPDFYEQSIPPSLLKSAPTLGALVHCVVFIRDITRLNQSQAAF